MRSFARNLTAFVLLAGVATGRASPQAVLAPDTLGRAPHGKSKLLPALEVTGFLVLLSAYDRIAYAGVMENGKKVFSSTVGSTWDHLRRQHWVHDPDGFSVNQFGHPYQGATMYGLARASGRGFWTSLIHADVGSFVWEMAGETPSPSVNDLITTGQAGSLLGEALYRMADLVLKVGGRERPRRWHEYAATLVSPPAGFNRRVYGDRFKAKLPDTAPATSWQVRFGATLEALARDYSSPATLLRRDASVEFAMAYGLPGQPGYDYTRPLDYFDVQFAMLSSATNPIENVMIRGLLIGRATKERAGSRGIWGLYGSYDYISPYLFRVSSTALSVGTTRQHRITDGVALQGTLLAGVGYGAAGSNTIIASTPTSAALRDYHMGVTPQALLALRLIAGDRAVLDMTAREFYVSGTGSDDTHGSETIFRGRLGLTLRLLGAHALGAHFVASTRDAQYGKQPSGRSSEGTLNISYSILGGNGLRAVAW